MPVANDEIRFAVASALALIDHRRALLDARTRVPRRLFVHALGDALLALAKALEQTMKRATALLVAMNQRVRTRGLRSRAFDVRASCDLLRTPRAAQLLDDPSPRLRCFTPTLHASAASTPVSAQLRFVMPPNNAHAAILFRASVEVPIEILFAPTIVHAKIEQPILRRYRRGVAAKLSRDR